MKYTPIIGLEVHVELKTKSKMFCGCDASYFGKDPNTHVCPVCLGLPGALPVPNKTAIEWCTKIALALNCKISTFSKFDRKNYFYPDLPKGYQISQYDLPFGTNGSMTLSNGRTIRIRRVHMEEDTGKLTHQDINGESMSLIDFNRSGLPLVEIVTEPDFHEASDVKEYLQNLRQIVRDLDVSNADMEKGDMRLEPNISLTTDPETLPDYKVEVKNINSFRFVEKAIAYEIKRQAEILDRGETPVQETRGWNENKNLTFSQRVKEEANDYRYFPEPDIPPITMTESQISSLRDSLPESRDKKSGRLMDEYGITEYDATLLTKDTALTDFFEQAAKLAKTQNLTPKHIANAIINQKIDPFSVTPEELVRNVASTHQVAKLDDTELDTLIEGVIGENQKAVEDYRNGKEASLMFLLGQVMRKAGKKIDAHLVKEKLSAAISK